MRKIKLLTLVLPILVVGCTHSNSPFFPGLEKNNIATAPTVAKPKTIAELYKDTNFVNYASKVINFSGKFAEAFYSYFAEENSKNSVISPMSVNLCLSLLTQCVANNSKDELLNFLGVTDQELKTYYKTLFELQNITVKDEGSTTERVLQETDNSIWYDKGFSYHQDAFNNLANNFYTNSFIEDFRNNAPKAIEDLNKYVETKTRGLIKLDFKDLIDSLTRFVLLNTLYFKDVWKESGNALGQTNDLPFYNYDGTKSQIKYNITEYIAGRKYETRKYTSFYSRTYSGFKIHVMLPNEGYTTKDLLNKDLLNEVSNGLEYVTQNNDGSIIYETNLYLPSFELESKQELNNFLKDKCGVNDIFYPSTADFTTLTDEKNIYVSNVIHAAKVKVDKKGMEGAAITAVVGRATSVGPGPAQVIRETLEVNKPFVLQIINPDGFPIFTGKVEKL